MMREIIYSLPDQIAEAINFVADFNSKAQRLNRILICGMGGSGISGEILAAINPELEIIINKDYTIPQYIKKDTLAILVSYSGNTEETLSNYITLAQKKIKTILISSNGALLKKTSILKIKIPEGLPPRGALGYLFTPQPILLYKFGLISADPKKKLLALVHFLKKYRAAIENKAKKLVDQFIGQLPIIYFNSQLFRPVATRWQCQLNENAKVLAHINALPEMNHNEIVGLGRPEALNKKLLIIFLNDPEAHPKNKLRVKIIKEIIHNKISNMIDINPIGNNNYERVFSTIMLGDFISYYLALKTDIDPMPVKRIEYLKKRLSE